MKKFSLTLAVVALSVASQAAPIYDSIFSSAAATATRDIAFTSSNPNSRLAGVFALDKNAGSFSLDSLGFLVVNNTNATIRSETVAIDLYQGVDPNAYFYGTTDPLFTNPAFFTGSVTVTFAAGIAPGFSGLGVADFTGTGITLDDQHPYGYMLSSGVQDVTFGITYGNANYVGDDFGVAGYFNDLNNDAIITGDETQFVGSKNINTNESLGLVLTGTQAVPEPAALAPLALGLVAILRRRKKA